MRIMVSALLGILIAGTASAQTTYGPPERAPTPKLPGILPQRIPSTILTTGKIRRDVQNGREDGTLSKREARQLRRDSRLIDGMAGRYGEDGLSDAEANELNVRTQVLHDSVVMQRTGGMARKR